MTKTIFSILSYLIVFNSLAINSLPSSNKHVEPNVLDSIQFRVLYQFQQQANKLNEQILLTDTMALDIGRDWSEYYDWYKPKLDSLSRLVSTHFEVLFIKENDEELNARLDSGEEEYKNSPRTPESSKIYKDRKNKTIHTFDDGPEVKTGSSYLMLNESVPPMNWTIYSDTATVLNYLCRRATATFRGRAYNAWFTSDIPVNEGPWKLYGLPGLILKAETTDGVFQFTAIGLENVNNLTIVFPDEREIIPATNLAQLYKFRDNRRRKTDIILVKNNLATAYMTKNPIIFEDLESEKE